MIPAVVARALAELLLAAAWSPRPVRADAVVGTGTAGSCTEETLDTALAGGGSVTFNCGGAATITVTSTKTISADTTIDGDAGQARSGIFAHSSPLARSGAKGVNAFGLTAAPVLYQTSHGLTRDDGNGRTIFKHSLLVFLGSVESDCAQKPSS